MKAATKKVEMVEYGARHLYFYSLFSSCVGLGRAIQFCLVIIIFYIYTMGDIFRINTIILQRDTQLSDFFYFQNSCDWEAW